MAMNDDNMVQIMESLGLNFNPAERSIKSFEGRVAALNKSLFDLKANAIAGARDINQAFSGQIGSMAGSKQILDQFGQPLKTIQDEAKKTAAGVSSMEGAYTKSSRAAKAHGQSVKDVAKQYNVLGNEMQRRTSWFMTGGLFYGGIAAAKETVQTISEVEMGVTQIGRVMEDSNFVFKNYRDDLLQLGVDYGQTFETVQDIALRWAQAGYNVKDSLENTKTSLLALNTAELDASNATESMIGIMAQWKLTSADLPLMLDKINKTADDFTITSQDLVDGLLRSSGAARIMGLSLDQTISLLTVMREASGRTGREVGNALNSILSYVQRPGSIKTFENMGIKVFADEAKTQFRNVMEIFKDVGSKWDTVSKDVQDGFLKSADDAGLFSEEMATALGLQDNWNDLQQRDLSQAAAGVYRRNYFIGMIERLSGAQKVLNGITDAAGYSQTENARTMDTLEKKYVSLKAAAEQLAVAIGDAGALDALKTLIDLGTGVVDIFTQLPEPMQQLIINFVLITAAIKAFKAASNLLGFGELVTGINNSVKAQTLLNNAIKVGTITQAEANTIQKAWNTGVQATTLSTKAAKVQTELFGIAVQGTTLKMAAFQAIIGFGIPLAISAIIAAFTHFSQSQEDAKQKAQELRQELEAQKDEIEGLDDIVLRYEEASKAVLSDKSAKSELVEMQKQLIDTYGKEAEHIDLVNGKRDTEIEKIRKLKKEKLEDYVAENFAKIAEMQRSMKEDTQSITMTAEAYEKIAQVHKLNNNTFESRGNVTFTDTKEKLYKLLGDILKAQEQFSRDAGSAESFIGNDAVAKLQDEYKGLKGEIEGNIAAIDIFNEYQKNLFKEQVGDFGLTEAQQKMFDALALKVEYDPSNKDKYKQALEEIKKAIVEAGTDAEKLKTSLSFLGSLKGIDLSELFGGKTNTGNQVKQATEDAIALQEVYNKKMDKASKAFANAVNKSETLSSALKELNGNHKLSSKTLEDLIMNYPELIDSMGNEATLSDAINEMLKVEQINQRKLFQNKIENSETYFNDVIKGNATMWNDIADSYGTDSENFKTLNDVKKANNDLLIRYLGESWGKLYGNEVEALQQALNKARVTPGMQSEIAKIEERLKTAKELAETTKITLDKIDWKKLDLSDSKDITDPTKTYTNKALENALNIMEHKKHMNQLSLADEIKTLKHIRSVYAKTAKERMDLDERIYDAEKALKEKREQDAKELAEKRKQEAEELADKLYQASKDWIDRKKALEQLSIKEEIAAWERVLKTQKNNIEAVKEANENLYRLRKQLVDETYSHEESAIQHWARMGVYGIQQQIDKYRELYSIKKLSTEEQWKLDEEIQGKYKDLIQERLGTVKDAIDEETKAIEEAAKSQIKIHEDKIKAIEAEEKKLDQTKTSDDHHTKRSALEKDLAYWSVRTSKEAKEKVAEINKEIRQLDEDYTDEVHRQRLEDEKQAEQDEITRINEDAEKKKEALNKLWDDIQEIFEGNNLDLITAAMTTSKAVWDEWDKNFFQKISKALEDPDYISSTNPNDPTSSLTVDGTDGVVAGSDKLTKMKHDWASSKYPSGMSDKDYNKMMANGKHWQELSKSDMTASKYKEMQDISAENDALRKKYGRDPKKGEYPEFHKGAKTLSYGIAMFKPGELVFPPGLSTKLESLISILDTRPISQLKESQVDRRVIQNFHAPLFNSEKTVFEDDMDGEVLSRQLKRAIVAVK